MKTEDYILEITRILQTLDTLQLLYVYTYIKGYFDIEELGLANPPNELRTKQA